MTTVETTHDKLVLTVHGFDIILALKHRLEIPLAHVLGAEVGVTDEVRERLSHSLRLPGTASYKVSADARVGHADVGVPQSPSSAHVITATTDVGAIKISTSA